MELGEAALIVVPVDLFALFAINLAQFHGLELLLLWHVTSRYIVRGIKSRLGIVIQLHYLLELSEAVDQIGLRSLVRH